MDAAISPQKGRASSTLTLPTYVFCTRYCPIMSFPYRFLLLRMLTLLLVLSYSLFFNEHSPSFWLLKQLSKLPYSTTTHPTHRPHTPFSPFRQNLRDLGKSLHPPASRALGKGHAGSTYSNLCTVCASRRSFSNDRVISTVHQVLDLGGSATKTGERALIRCEICAEQTLQCAPDAPSCMFIILMSPQETRVTYNSQRYTPHMYTFSRLE